MSTTEAVPLSMLAPGTRGRIVRVVARDLSMRAERLGAVGVSAGARVRVLKRCPGLVFECDRTEVAVERGVAGSIWIEVEPL